MEDFSHRDVITIEIRGEQAKQVLLDLQNTLTSIEVKLRELGASMDAAFVHIAGPLKGIEVSTAQTVQQLEILRSQIAGLGPAGVAGPETVTTQFQRMRNELGLTAADVSRLRYELSQVGAVPMLPAPGRMLQAQLGIGAFARPEVEPGPTMYVTPTGTTFTAAQVSQMADAHRAAARAADDYAVATGRVTRETGRMRGATDRSRGSFQRHIRWFIEGTILYMTISRAIRAVGDAFSDTISVLSEYDLAMAQVGFITGQAEAQLGSLLDQVVSVGAQYALLPEEIVPGAVDVTRAFRDQADQLIITENAAKLALMTGISYEQAVDQLVSITKQWNIEAKDSGQVLDVLAIAYQKSMVPLDDLSRGLAKGAPLAEMMGLELGELGGILSELAEITVLEPEQALVMFRRLTAAPFRPDVARELRREFGIEVFVPGTVEQHRQVWAILQDVARVWGTIDSEQKATLANLLAGSQVLGGQGPQLKMMLDSWEEITAEAQAYQAELERGGQAQEYISEILGTLPLAIQTMTAEWKAFLLAAGETTGVLEGIKGLVGDITDGLRTWRFILLLGEETGISAWEALWGEMRGLTPQQIVAEEIARTERAIEVERVAPYRAAWPLEPRPSDVEASERRIAELERQLEILRGERPMGPAPPTPGLAVSELPREVGRFITQQEILEYQQRGILATTDEWIRELNVGRGIIDVTALSQEQVNQALAASVQMVQGLTEGYIAHVEAMQGGVITAEQREEIEKRVKEWYEDQTVVLKDQAGIFQVISGAQAAMFQQAMRQMEALDRMGVRRLRDFTPEMLSQVVQTARLWEQRLGMMGFQEEARRALLIGEEPSFWLTFEGSMTALRFAISDLQDSMEDQTAVLRGHFNIPGGYVVPTPWDFYAAVGMQGPVGVGPVNYPPEVLQRYYGYQFGGDGGGGAGLPGGMGPLPAAWAGTIPRQPGWDVGDWSGLLGQAGGMYGLDPRLLAAIMQVESGGVPTATGAPTRWGRAQGLMQVMPFHEGRLQPGETLRDPWANIRIGAEILAEAIGRYGVPTGIAAYYGGVSEGAVTPAGEMYLGLVEGAFRELFGGRPEGQEIMTIQGIPEVQRVLTATKTTQDAYLATIAINMQSLITVNRSILVAVQRQLQPQVTVILQDTGTAIQQGKRSGLGKGGAVVGHRPEQY